MTSSAPHTNGSTPTTVSETSTIDTLPEFAALDLSLSRDQGTLHALGFGSGSEAFALSEVAEKQHSLLAGRILSQSSAHAALSPENLPVAPTELPKLTEGALEKQEGLLAPGSAALLSAAESSAGTSSPQLPGVSSTFATPGVSRDVSRVGTPVPATASATPPVHPPTAVAYALQANGIAAPASPTSTPLSPTPSAPMMSNKSTSSVAGAKVEKKSVFGKLFDRNNVSTNSLPSGEKMERGDSSGTNGSAAGVAGAAPLVRKPSKKETEKADKDRREKEKAVEKANKEAEKLLRVPSAKDANGSAPAGTRVRSPSQPGDREGGMGQALNDFMRNKVQRKTSVTSKKSEDGKSERGGSQAGDSQYGASTDGKSKSGQTTASLLKKYGVCEKVAIGKGATATVKLAHKWDRTTERLYAVKVRCLLTFSGFTAGADRGFSMFVGVPEEEKERDGEGVRQEAHVRVLHQFDAPPVRFFWSFPARSVLIPASTATTSSRRSTSSRTSKATGAKSWSTAPAETSTPRSRRAR